MADVVALAVVALVLATPTFLATARRRDAGARPRRPASPVQRALLPLVPLTLAAALLSPWMPWSRSVGALAVLWATTLVWLPLSRRWSAWAHTSWGLGVAAGAAYLLAMTAWTLSSGLSAATLAAAWVLLALEASAYVLFLSYAFELHDSLGSRRWDRRRPLVGSAAVGATEARGADAEVPFVSIHVPCHNEPPELVVETLERLLRLDHLAYEVLVIDNNTDYEALWTPVEAFCARHPELLRFHRLVDWPGFKSGALNYALEHVDPRTALIGVVDADYQVDPDWLRDATAPFADPRVAFVQSPQDYRGWEHVQYLRSLYHSYDYFFAVSQPSRDERDAAIFGGTMGLVRREALLAVGGWDEWCVTEDAELSLRLLAAGWSGLHLDRAYGHGLMPLTFEALKRQRFRWCFGGMQILKRHSRLLLGLGGRGQLTAAQRLGYLFGGIQWFGDLLGLVFSLVVMASLVDLAVGGGLVVQRLAGLLLVAVPAVVLLGVVRAVAGIRAASRAVPEHAATWRDAVGAFLVWLSLGWVVSLATVRGLAEPRGVFLRTPKVSEQVRWVDAVRANRAETALLVLAVACATAGVVGRPGPVTAGLVGLLMLPASGWLAAPLHTVAAMHADLPRDLRAQRASERRRGWWRPQRRTSIATLLGAVAVGALVLVVVQPGSTDAPTTPALPRLPLPSPSGQAPTPASSPTGPAPGSTSSSSGPSAPTTTPPSAGVPTPTASGSSAPTPTAPPTTTPAPTRTTPVPPTTAATPTSRPTSTGRPTATPRPSATPTGRP